MAGRKSKYTPECVKAILQAIEIGLPYRHAAAYGGICEDTLANWRANKPDFSASIKEAEARALMGRLARIRKAEDEHWQAAAWWAERKYPSEFGRTVQDHNISGSLRREYVLVTPDAVPADDAP